MAMMEMLDSQNNHGKTPLHLAAENGHLDIVKKLVELGVNITIRDNDGKTAFDLAKNHIQVASYLGRKMGEKFVFEKKYEDAVKVYEELFEIQKEKLGCHHSETTKTSDDIESLQDMLHAMGHSVPKPPAGVNGNFRDNGGETAFDLVKDRKQVAKYLCYEMGEKFQVEQKYEDALKVYNELLEVQKEELGCDHSETTKTASLAENMRTIISGLRLRGSD